MRRREDHTFNNNKFKVDFDTTRFEEDYIEAKRGKVGPIFQ